MLVVAAANDELESLPRPRFDQIPFQTPRHIYTSGSLLRLATSLPPSSLPPTFLVVAKHVVEPSASNAHRAQRHLGHLDEDHTGDGAHSRTGLQTPRVPFQPGAFTAVVSRKATSQGFTVVLRRRRRVRVRASGLLEVVAIDLGGEATCQGFTGVLRCRRGVLERASGLLEVVDVGPHRFGLSRGVRLGVLVPARGDSDGQGNRMGGRDCHRRGARGWCVGHFRLVLVGPAGYCCSRSTAVDLFIVEKAGCRDWDAPSSFSKGCDGLAVLRDSQLSKAVAGHVELGRFA
ncbi:hypothetical protein DFP72DRAFT_1053991 [Ephemerocybe angulata]|uniref:Uncharacterized protein n=1 Tax=Ephemerocybe angulata TaxID=980116 RepID=A0A8H6HAE0_9AGAR|nr:hypothetical protein DFP72DRAFT_1053991 [Tulosesus angulatus]